MMLEREIQANIERLTEVEVAAMVAEVAGSTGSVADEEERPQGSTISFLATFLNLEEALPILIF